MKSKRITGLIALALCAVLAFSGQGWAVDSSSPYHVSKWESKAASTTMYSVFSDYYSVNSSEYTWRKFNSNCFYFARWVTNQLSNVDFNLQCNDYRGIYFYGGHVKGVGSLQGKSVDEIAKLLGQHLNNVSGTPSEQQVRNIFASAQVGDVVQFVGWSWAGEHTMIIAQKYDDGFDTLEGNNPKNTVRNNYLSYSDFRNIVAAAGSSGGFSVYHFGTSEIPDPDPDPTPDPKPRPTINQGLLKLTSNKYAKIFTLTSVKYYNLYSNKELTSRLSSSAWTGENDEDWLLDVGVNSSNVVYAHISYPISSGRREAYVKLSEIFVKGSIDDGIIKAVNNCYGLYKRQNSGQTWSYGIDAGDECYLLTAENGWYQVMYPITGKNYWRIAWMTEGQYTSTFPPVIIPPEITSVNNIPASVVAGSSYRGMLTASGATSIIWKTSNGTPTSSASNYLMGLPSGLSISGTGTTATISGYPSHTSLGQSSRMPLYYFFNVTATNAGGSSAPKSSYVVVYEPPVFETSETLAKGDVNQRYSQTIKAKGTEYSMRWKIIEGKLPPGLTFTGNPSTRTATISGFPTRSGYYRFKVQLYNFVGNANTTTTKWFTIAIGNVAAEWKDSTKLPFTYTFMNASTGKNYSDWVGVKDTSSGTKDPNNYIFLVSEGSLPPGLYIEEKSSSSYTAGMVYLKGVPSTAGTYNFTIKAKRISDGGYNTKNFTINVTSSTASVWKNNSMSTTWYFLPGKMRVTYRDYIRVNGGSAPYTPSVVGGELPPGTRLEQNGVYTYLTGVPKQNGDFTFKLRITGSNGGYVEKNCTVTIANNSLFKSGGSTKDSKPKFTSKALPDAYIGRMWEATLDTYGTEPIAYYAEDPLPEWLTLDEETGTLSGIPMEKGKYKLRIRAENELGSATKTFKVKVVLASPAVLTSELPEGYTGVPYETRLEASGTDPIKWSKIGTLPGGLKLDKTLGIISGTPKKEGSFDFSIKAKNKAGTDTVQLRIVIRKSADEPTKKDESGDEYDNDDEDDEDDTEEATAKVLSTVYSKSEESLPVSSGFAPSFTKLYALSDGEKLEGSVNVEAGKPLEFEIGEWVDEYGRDVDVSKAKIFVNDENISADISDGGTFTLPAEIVSGEMIVYVSAQTERREIRTLEVNAVTEAESVTFSGTTSDNSGNEESNAGGCNFSLLGLAGLLFCTRAMLRRK